MAEPENQTLRLLRDIRGDIKGVKDDLSGVEQRLDRKIDDVREDLGQRIKNLQQAMIGESVLGRYTVAEVEERLERIETRLSVLEKRK